MGPLGDPEQEAQNDKSPEPFGKTQEGDAEGPGDGGYRPHQSGAEHINHPAAKRGEEHVADSERGEDHSELCARESKFLL